MNWLPPPQNIDADLDDEDEATPAIISRETPWALPPIDLLVGQAPVDESTSRPDNAMRAALIVETLASFGVDARVSAYHEGPVVTQFDIEPGWEIKYRTVPERDKDGRPAFDKDGHPRTRQEEVSRTRVRVNEITRLSNDLALALAAPSLRIEAPVPGRSVVGIEVPNTAASVVTMRSVIETPAFQRLSARTKIALPLGKSVSGEPVVADLAKMPHLLIAGATGAGKSVAINTIISSILMQSRPEDVRFVMIDPKRVELSGFALIPHLAFSNIVVDMEKVVGTLGAVLHEMESRYKRFAALAVRNIEAYNKHPKAGEKLPFWVVIIDELADLMMAAPFEVERQICRLAQLARATGIHLIVATQRPSVDVITGLIKANFPTRIAFAMSSQVDSRTILDMAGAERLLGRGDMLYMPTDASKPKRVQGVYVSDAEIDRIVAFWAQQRATHSTLVYDHLLEQAQAEVEQAEDNDPMYEKAKALAEEHTRISTSMLQRRLRIGYPRAARIMDRLEDEGYAGGGGGGGAPIVSLDGVIEEEDSPF
jgi:S-DNA-T family DNA segregation ATPase FtsK/SpoIIIE